jgi:NTE family protein
MNAVFQGGGVKGIALVGALQVLESNGFEFNKVGGTSAGSIVAALYAAGYSSETLVALLKSTDFAKLLGKKRSWLGFLRSGAFYSTAGIYRWMYGLLLDKGIRVFKDVNEKELRIVAADLTKRRILEFNRDDNPTMEIAEAVRMSISIPLFFDPMVYGESLIVDGGVVSNHPIWLFGRGEEDTVGFRLLNLTKAADAPTRPRGVFTYAIAFADTVMSAHDSRDREEFNYKLVEIDNGGIPSTKFSLSDSEKGILLENGRAAAAKFINSQGPFLPKDTTLVTKDISISREQGEEWFRLSLSGLFRMQVNGGHFLVKGRERQLFQPVGGVYKAYQGADALFQELGVLSDRNVLSAHCTERELRIRLRGKNVARLVEWFRTRKEREVTPEREFREELIESHIVNADIFSRIEISYLQTHYDPITFSTHFQCYELRVAEIFDILLTPDQQKFLVDLQGSPDSRYGFFNAGVIQTRGVVPPAKLQETIARHATWIL